MSPSRIHSIHIYFISQEDQRYPTVGDWHIADGATLNIAITQQPDQRMSWPVAVHELAEALLCHDRGITWKQVDQWDIAGEGAGKEDPGSDPRAPYFAQHMQACKLEDLMVEYLDLDPEAYQDALAIGDTHDDAQ